MNHYYSLAIALSLLIVVGTTFALFSTKPVALDPAIRIADATLKDRIIVDFGVAHKFGTRVADGPGGRQLHDCGIVYAPKTPYILCVMSRGNSSQNLSHFIAQVSKRVYEGVTC